MKTNLKFVIPFLLLFMIVAILLNYGKISNALTDVIEARPKPFIVDANEYKKNHDFLFVQNSDDYTPYSYQELLNIFFSSINNGWDNFTLYCPKEYTSCLNDVKHISMDDILLTDVNNFTHPFNNFISFKTSYYETGEVTINITKLYSREDIIKINTRVDEILPTIVNDEMNDVEKIRAIHDYIINNAQYDVTRNTSGGSRYMSNSAIGALLQGWAICSGYSDAMAIMISRLGIPNFKVASATHVWNAVYVDGKWSHIDLTWDDPVSADGTQILWHKYFMISSEDFLTLDEKNETDHVFDKTVYLELK